jgi:hypothetical protein
MMHTAFLMLILSLGGGAFHPGGLLDLVAATWAGNSYDPNGEAATSDAGNHFDPNGQTGDAGGSYDPNG